MSHSQRLPVGYWYFSQLSGFPSAPYILPEESLLSENHPITRIIRWAHEADLHVILDLHGAPGSQNGFDNSGMQAPKGQPDSEWGHGWLDDAENVEGTVATTSAMAAYVAHIENHYGLDNVIALEVLNEPYVFLDLDAVRGYYLKAMDAVRGKHETLPIFLHDAFRLDEWNYLLDDLPHNSIFMDNHNYFAFYHQWESSVEEDKWKQELYSEMACKMTTSLKHSSCASAPVMVGEWSLAIDNCMPRLDMRFEDVGQCTHITNRLDDPWWTEKVKDFAMKQIYVYEQTLGWIFWTWKVDDVGARAPSAPYWSFKLALQKGYIDSSAYGVPACFEQSPQPEAEETSDTTTDLADEIDQKAVAVETSVPVQVVQGRDDSDHSEDSPLSRGVSFPYGHTPASSTRQAAAVAGLGTIFMGVLGLVAVGGILAVLIEVVRHHRRKRAYRAIPQSRWHLPKDSVGTPSSNTSSYTRKHHIQEHGQRDFLTSPARVEKYQYAGLGLSTAPPTRSTEIPVVTATDMIKNNQNQRNYRSGVDFSAEDRRLNESSPILRGDV